MFDTGLDRQGTLACAEASYLLRNQADATLLEVAAHWADLHHPDSVPPPATTLEANRRRLEGEVPARFGGDGTPSVLSHCPGELALVLHTTSVSAQYLIGDALDLRHRLPSLWTEVQTGGVRAWQARQVASATRPLSLEQALEVDAGIVGLVTSLAWSRFEQVLAATIATADPAGARAKEQEAARRRFVGVTRGNEHHIKTLIARGDALDILSFLATVTRIADLLEAEGDSDPLDERKAKAVGILAHPARALDLLNRHRAKPARQAGGPADDDEDDRDEEAADEPGEVTAADLTCGGEPDPEGDAHTTLHADQPNPPIDAQTGTAAKRCGCAHQVQLHVHLTDHALTGRDPRAVCRVDGVGPVTAATVRTWLGRPDLKVTVRPTLVPGEAVPVDSYEIPASMRNALKARNPGSVYPWSPNLAPQDGDHTIPFLDLDKGGPSGQTNLGNLAPLGRREHNEKTFGRIQQRQPAPGVYLWRSRHGWIYLTTNQGTFPLGNNDTAHGIWAAAVPRERPAEEEAAGRLKQLISSYLRDLPPVVEIDLSPHLTSASPGGP